MPAFDIFKADVPVVSMEGASVNLSKDQLRGIAERYDPKLHEAPIVIGHPQHDTRAWGWVSGLSTDATGATLAADERQVDASFADLRSRGAYKKVSARFYTPTSPNNPTPGEYYLRDVGFLGATPPAMKGLQSYSFADGSDVVSAEISFGDLPGYSGLGIARMFRSFRDWLIGKEGLEVADRVLPEWEIDSLRETSQREADEPRASNLSSFGERVQAEILSALGTSIQTVSKEPTNMKTPEQLQSALDAANAQLQQLQQADAKRTVEARHAEHVSFADGLIQQARWPAGLKDVLVASLDHLATPVDTGCVSFGEGDAAKPLHQVLREQLTTLPELVSFGEVAGKGKGGGDKLSDREIADRASAYQHRMQGKGQTISIGAAINAVNAGTDKE